MFIVTHYVFDSHILRYNQFYFLLLLLLLLETSFYVVDFYKFTFTEVVLKRLPFNQVQNKTSSVTAGNKLGKKNLQT